MCVCAYVCMSLWLDTYNNILLLNFHSVVKLGYMLDNSIYYIYLEL